MVAFSFYPRKGHPQTQTHIGVLVHQPFLRAFPIESPVHSMEFDLNNGEDFVAKSGQARKMALPPKPVPFKSSALRA